MSSIFSGWSARQNAKRNAGILEEETRAAAAQKTRDLKKLEGSQRLAFAKSGVTLEGSPLMVLEETRQQGTAEIRDLLMTGYRKAAGIRTAGRQAFIGGILKGGEEAAAAIATGGMSEASKSAKQYSSSSGSAGAKQSSFSSGETVTWDV